MIADNLKDVTRRIARSCEKAGRPASDVRLVCVTKEAALEDVKEVIGLGVTDIGENRVKSALSKYKAIGEKTKWHLIGHLQTNKARDAVKIFSLIHSLDSLKLASALDGEAKKAGKVQDALVQVNVSGEESKFGIRPDETPSFLKELRLYPNINILGLMTIAPEVAVSEEARPYFRQLRELRDSIGGLKELSMGMTGDFEVAIEEGATLIRVGRAIFNG